MKERKKENGQRKGKRKERKQTTQGRDGRTVRRHHTGILGEKSGASRRPPSGVYHFLSLFAVSHQFSQRPSCHLAFFPLSSFSLLLFHPLTHRSPRPRSERVLRLCVHALHKSTSPGPSRPDRTHGHSRSCMHTLHTPARAVVACTQVELYRDYLTELARRGFDNLSAGGDRVSISTPRKVQTIWYC